MSCEARRLKELLPGEASPARRAASALPGMRLSGSCTSCASSRPHLQIMAIFVTNDDYYPIEWILSLPSARPAPPHLEVLLISSQVQSHFSASNLSTHLATLQKSRF